MACNALDPISCAGDIMVSGMAAMAKSFADGAAEAVKTMTTAWLGVPSPDVSSSSQTIVWLQAHLSYFVLVAVLASVLFTAYRMATSGSFEAGGELAHSLFRLIVISGCVAAASTIALQVGDLFAEWIVGGSSAYFLGSVAVFGAVTNPGITIILGLVVILAQIVQLCIMLAKNAMIVLLVAFIPLTAAATNMPAGKQGFLKAITWLAAFLLYKPVAAVIYVAAFKLAEPGQGIAGQMSGVVLVILAIVALPALMKFLVPVTASVTGGNAGAMAGAVVGATLATGAVVATGGMSAGSGGFASAAPTGAAASSAGASGAASQIGPALNAASSGASLGGGNNDTDPVDKT